MKISAIIPVYKCEKYIAQTLENLIYQTHKDLEIIAVIDGSPDNSEKIIREYAKRDKRIKVISLAKNSGVSVAKNTGIATAAGEYLHFMDADDLVNLEFYEKMAAAAVQADADIAVSDSVHERKPNWNLLYENRMVAAQAADKFNLTQALNRGHMWRYIFRRKFWNANKFSFPAGVRTIEDGITIPKVVLAANRVVSVPGAVYIYKNRDGSLMTMKDRSHRARLRENIATEDEFIKNFMSENDLTQRVNLIRRKKWKTIFNIKLGEACEYSDGVKKFYFFGLRVLTV